jgi:hypothetical protein
MKGRKKRKKRRKDRSEACALGRLRQQQETARKERCCWYVLISSMGPV